MQAAILACLQLWSEKYEEEFQEFVLGFVSTAWALVTKTSLQQKYDKARVFFIFSRAFCRNGSMHVNAGLPRVRGGAHSICRW
jgi:hypothetical protein